MGFSKEWAEKHTKDQFIKAHKAHEADCDLSAEYDKLVPPKEKAPAKTEAKEPEKGE